MYMFLQSIVVARQRTPARALLRSGGGGARRLNCIGDDTFVV